jgi:GLPGLI family protein
MKTTSILILFFVVFFAGHAVAQRARFLKAGVIEYEKTVNMYDIIEKKITKDNEGLLRPAFDQYKRSYDKFKRQKSALTFTADRTLYQPAADNGPAPVSFLFNDPAASQPNTIFTDLPTNYSVCQKKALGQSFLVKDTSRKILWKITDEIREIAGFSCRRANAIIMDSIYVVAFYTDRIPVSGGPESFTGLPGMILGVALPHQHVTWFATSVADKTIGTDAITAPVQGKQIDNNELQKEIRGPLKGNDQYTQFVLFNFLL